VGRDGISTIEQMAHLKAEVLRRARRAIVVNAEDRLCLRAAAPLSGVRRSFLRGMLITRWYQQRRGRGSTACGRAFFGREVIVHRRSGRRTELVAHQRSSDDGRANSGKRRQRACRAAIAIAWVCRPMPSAGPGSVPQRREQNPAGSTSSKASRSRSWWISATIRRCDPACRGHSPTRRQGQKDPCQYQAGQPACGARRQGGTGARGRIRLLRLFVRSGLRKQNPSLLACSRCGSRGVAGCACWRGLRARQHRRAGGSCESDSIGRRQRSAGTWS